MKHLFLLLFSLASVSFLSAQATFYDINTVQEIRLTFLQTNWDYMLDTAKNGSEGYIMAAQCSVNGVVFDSVGVKYKGNSSYNANNAKNPLHIELDYLKNQDYQGYTDIKLSNGKSDPTFVREVLSYEILANYMDCSKANFAKVYINNNYYGFMTSVESLNKSFMSDHFYTSSGTIVKGNPVGGAGPGSSALPTLKYINTDTTSYYASYEIKSDYGWKELYDLIDTLNNKPAEIAKILDVDRALWMLSFDNVLVNLDSYLGTFAQNYYLYRDQDRRFNSIVWDLNMSFGAFSMLPTGNLNVTSMISMSPLVLETNTSRPLIKNLLADATYKRMYMAHLRTIAKEMFSTNSYYTRAQQIQSIISADVQADNNKFYTNTQFTSNLTTDITGGGGPGGGMSIPGITHLMDARYTSLAANADFQKVPPTLAMPTYTPTSPALGNTIWITAAAPASTNVLLGSRGDHTRKFNTQQMYDDGAHQDGAANDGTFGASIPADAAVIEYYVYAENSNAGIFSPQRAEHEFYTITVNIPLPNVGAVVINEFLSDNLTNVVDPSGQNEDWIEMYNNTATDIELTGLYLSDDASIHNKWAFPNGTIIPANGFLIIWADQNGTQSGLHANFKLKQAGEMLILSNGGSVVLDSVMYPAQVTDVSYGRYPNGTGSFTAMPTTYFAVNSTFSGIENASTSFFKLYPNPTQGDFTLDSEQKIAEVVVLNALGQVVYQIQNATTNTLTIPTENWNAGVYFVRVNNLENRRLVVVR